MYEKKLKVQNSSSSVGSLDNISIAHMDKFEKNKLTKKKTLS